MVYFAITLSIGTEAANSAKRGASPCADLTCAPTAARTPVASRQPASEGLAKQKQVNEQIDTYQEIESCDFSVQETSVERQRGAARWSFA